MKKCVKCNEPTHTKKSCYCIAHAIYNREYHRKSLNAPRRFKCGSYEGAKDETFGEWYGSNG